MDTKACAKDWRTSGSSGGPARATWSGRSWGAISLQAAQTGASSLTWRDAEHSWLPPLRLGEPTKRAMALEGHRWGR
eukprot:4647573-Pyramimonas_sp.AAC.1